MSLDILPPPTYPRLQTSDHRRAVRPKARQKASVSHLKMLGQRSDVSSEIITPKEAGSATGLDPNTYSTYMGKRVCNYVYACGDTTPAGVK